jgi:hypothetical protein
VSEADLPEITEIRRVALSPGDVVVARLKGRISQAAADSVSQRLKGAFPDNRVVLLDGRIDLDIVTAPAPAEPVTEAQGGAE